MKDVIELLSDSLIDEYAGVAMDVLGYSSKFGRALGWHYLLDLIWILKELSCPPGSVILDAGSGSGLLQFMLALKGYYVVGCDIKRPGQPAFIKNCCAMRFFEDEKISVDSFDSVVCKKRNEPIPEVWFYQADLENLSSIRTNTFDAIVSVSALEHNPPDKIPNIMDEFSRVLKKDAYMFLTVSGARESARHEPSNSWLINENEMYVKYKLQQNYESNFSKFDEIFKGICDSERLQKWLASFYFQGGNNGMPFGKWSPQYQPIAIRKKNIK